MRVLVVSADPEVRALMGLAVQGVRRKMGHDEPFELLHASDGLAAMAIAWRADPDVVIADEITSRAGAFALTMELKGAERPYAGRIVILLDRSVDAWLAAWSGADAWFVKPVNPFELAATVTGFFRYIDQSASLETLGVAGQLHVLDHRPRLLPDA